MGFFIFISCYSYLRARSENDRCRDLFRDGNRVQSSTEAHEQIRPAFDLQFKENELHRMRSGSQNLKLSHTIITGF